mgnify:CR=1 FL=1
MSGGYAQWGRGGNAVADLSHWRNVTLNVSQLFHYTSLQGGTGGRRGGDSTFDMSYGTNLRFTAQVWEGFTLIGGPGGSAAIPNGQGGDALFTFDYGQRLSFSSPEVFSSAQITGGEGNNQNATGGDALLSMRYCSDVTFSAQEVFRDLTIQGGSGTTFSGTATLDMSHGTNLSFTAPRVLSRMVIAGQFGGGLLLNASGLRNIPANTFYGTIMDG